jgi:hypothetical protein
MVPALRRAVLLAAALAVPAAAQNASEPLSAAGAARFEAAALEPSAGRFRPAAPAAAAEDPGIAAQIADSWVDDLRRSIESLRSLARLLAEPKSIADLELAPLLNRNQKTSLHYTLSGRGVWFGGSFDHSQNPFVSILVDGAAPVYHNVKDLVHRSQKVAVGGTSYTLSLSPNIFHKLKSSINLRNDSNSREGAGFTVSDMLDAVSAAGQPLTVAGQPYKFYYGDGVNGDPRMFVFVHGSASDLHVYLVPEGSVPADAIGVFALHDGQRVGLSRRAGRLSIFENP